MNPLVIYAVCVNALAFIVAAWDKHRAICHKSRVSENTLMLFAVIGGGIGLMAAFLIIRHKTRKKKFMIGVPIIILIELITVFCAIYYFKLIK